jgi:hypothetical protein
MKRIAFVLATALLAASPAPSWLDAGSSPANWNTAATVPRAPGPPDRELARAGRCASIVRPPQFVEDRAVAAAGWHVWGAYQRYDKTALVLGTAGADGMCRPMGYQAFVFVGGRFAGTVAPHPMDARTDGSFSSMQLETATTVYGEFSRYAADDPLCCPHSTTGVSYELHTAAGRPVLTVDYIAPPPK